MPKFKIIKEGVNDALIEKVEQKVASYINELFHDYEVIKIEDSYTFSFGDININLKVIPWHTEDVLVEVYTYIAEDIEMNMELAKELLRLNATTHFGSFGVTFDQSVIFSYSLAGANLDLNEFIAAVQTVAMIADSYTEMIAEKA